MEVSALDATNVVYAFECLISEMYNVHNFKKEQADNKIQVLFN